MKLQVFRIFWYKLPIRDIAWKYFGIGSTQERSCPPWLSSPYKKWAYRNRLSGKMAEFITSQLSGQESLPEFSIITPVFNTPEDILRKTLQSVADQIYTRWEACIVDDGSNLSHVQKVLGEFAAKDTRFRILINPANEGLTAATNKALSLGKGDYCVFLDHDDSLEPDALAQVAQAIVGNPGADFFYTDNDIIGVDSSPVFSQFKPDLSPELHHSIFYFNHLTVIRREYLEKIGCSDNCRCSFDYDLTLRIIRDKGNIAHLPLVLYHWRDAPGRLSKSNDICFSESIHLLENSLTRSGITWARVTQSDIAKKKKFGIFQMVPTSEFAEKVSIIVTDRVDGKSVLPCIHALLTRTKHRNREIIIIVRDTWIDHIRSTLLSRYPGTGFSFVTYNSPDQCNWASIRNLAVQQAKGEFILFMDSGLVMESDQCLENLLLYGKFPGIGIVGGRIHDMNGKILEAGGVFTGDARHPVLHPCRGGNRGDSGYMNVLDVPKNYSMVSGSFFFVNREVFEICGGFDAKNFPDAFSDYDLCLNTVTKGFRVVSLPSVCLITGNNGSGLSSNTAELRDSVRFFERWKQYHDPYYNVNLSLEIGHSHWEASHKNTRLILFPLQERRTKVLSLSHEFRTGGAQHVKFILDASLHRKPDVSVDVLCPVQDDGILREMYLRENIPVTLVEGYWNAPYEDYCCFQEQIRKIMKEGAYDMVYANTLNCFWGIEAAYDLGIPTVWHIHEAYDPMRYFDMIIPDPAVRDVAKSSLVHANRLVFVSKAIRELFRRYDCFGVSDYIYNGIDCEKVDQYLEMNKETLKYELDLPQGKKIVSVIGTLTERKGQIDLVDAALDLLKTRNDLIFLIIGDFQRAAETRDYHAQIVERIGSENRIRVVPNPPDVYPYLRVTDIFVCTSRIESFGLVIQEAMAFRLPIITTPVFGIMEQVEHGLTGLTYTPGDTRILAAHLERLLSDQEYARLLGDNAGMYVRSAFRERDMTDRFYALLKTVAMEDINCKI